VASAEMAAGATSESPRCSTWRSGLLPAVASPDAGEQPVLPSAQAPSLGTAPRHMVIRSRVMQKPAKKNLQLAFSGTETSDGSLWSNLSAPGGDNLPMELVCVWPVKLGSQTSRSAPRVAKVKIQNRAPTESGTKTAGGRMRQLSATEIKELSPELRQELKEKLQNLQGSCRADIHMHPRSLRFLLKELQDVCELLGMPLPDRQYRACYRSHILHNLVKMMPPLPGGIDLPPSGVELPKGGFLTFSVLLALAEPPWEFTCNAVMHKVCDCGIEFPGAPTCVSPVIQSHAASAASTPRGSPRHPASLRAAKELLRVEACRRRERHFPQRLVELARALRTRFRELSGQVSTFIGDLTSIPENPARHQQARAAQSWEQLARNVLSEVSVFDQAVTQFERLYLSLVDRMIGLALEPVHAMSAPSDALVRGPTDPFRDMQTAIICERLGLLKRQVSSSVETSVTYFDPGLLGKARRVLQIDTFTEVQRMASEMLGRFGSLCRVLADLGIDQVNPELADNAALCRAVLELESIWAECQHLLEQASLDFIRRLLDFLPRLLPDCRWQLRVALQQLQRRSNGEQAAGVLELPEEVPPAVVRERACVTLLETLPVLMYVEEVWSDIAVAERTDSDDKHGPTGRGRFQDVFRPVDDSKHVTLKRELATLSEGSFAKFRESILGRVTETQDEEARSGQFKYFSVLFRKVAELVAFPCEVVGDASPLAATGGSAKKAGTVSTVSTINFGLTPATGEPPGSAGPTSPEDETRRRRMMEARVRWVCFHRVAQQAAPDLFPLEEPPLLHRRKAEGRRTTHRPTVLLQANSGVRHQSVTLPPETAQAVQAQTASASGGGNAAASSS